MLPKSAKLHVQAEIGYLIGYENQNTYCIWIPAKEKIISTRDVTFDETKFFKSTEEQQQLQDQMAEIIDFNKVEIEPHIKAISEEKEQSLMMPLSTRVQ